MTDKKTTDKKKKHAAVAASSAALRDQFAQAALLAYCHHTLAGEDECAAVAVKAYALADAMMDAREPPEEKPAGEHTSEPAAEVK